MLQVVFRTFVDTFCFTFPQKHLFSYLIFAHCSESRGSLKLLHWFLIFYYKFMSQCHLTIPLQTVLIKIRPYKKSVDTMMVFPREYLENVTGNFETESTGDKDLMSQAKC